MESIFKNTEIENINLPTTVTFTDNADKIVELLKSSDVNCIAESDGKTTKLTFDIMDIEKLNKILQPVGIDKQLDTTLSVPKVEKKEKLIPIANAMSNLYDRKINGKNSRIDAHQKHVDTLTTALERKRQKIDTLLGRNDMFKKLTNTFPTLKNPINALVVRNEKKIERLQKKDAKLEKQIEVHHNRIDKLENKVRNFTLRKKSYQSLSDIVRSFSITDKEQRNQTYLNALNSYNASIHGINEMKINSCNESIRKLQNDFQNLSSSAKQTVQGRITKLISTRNALENKNRVIKAANPDIMDMLNKLNDNTTIKAVDKAELMFDQSIKSSGQNFDTFMSSLSTTSSRAVSPTAADIVVNADFVITGINDRDGDMIPDKLDSKSINNNVQKVADAPQKRTTHIMLVTDEELDTLVKSKAPIKVNYKQRSEDGKIPIKMEKEDKPKIESILKSMKIEIGKARK